MGVAEFKNEALIDFSQEKNRKEMQAALEKVESSFGREILRFAEEQ